tara:strand:- start:96894 stop:98840 length:1947 start_codon:yes stop_codon:yes gene_type:complete
MTRLLLSLIVFWNFVALKGQRPPAPMDGLRLAFLSDVHFQDIHATFTDNPFKGIANPNGGGPVTIRTMESQLRSTRIFNENYFAFLAALEDLVAKGIKIVVMPGDFSDDGQAVHVRGLQKVLSRYEKEHGMQFFLITGNHDPVKPFRQEAYKNDFLGEGGKRQPISSGEGLYTPTDTTGENTVVISKDISHMGYEGIIDMLPDFGFFPDAGNLYWETPFSNYRVEDYNLTIAKEQSALQNRVYPIGPENLPIPDASYLVEPVEGLWLLALDANVYLLGEGAGEDPKNPKNYQGASIGYNNVLGEKKHLIQWVESVMERAGKLNKTVIAFSHYPMIDFNDGSTEVLKELVGSRKMQLQRVPREEVAQTFADVGLKIHFGGHMHMNDTGTRTTPKGNTLVNIQVPSLAAYLPAYKLLTFTGKDLVEIETVSIDSVPNVGELFDLYRMEHDFLLKHPGPVPIWDRDILEVKSYRAFTFFHLKELVRLRFVPNDWPKELGDFLMGTSGKELLVLSQLKKNVPMVPDTDHKKQDSNVRKSRRKVLKKVKTQLRTNGLAWKDMDQWNGLDLLTDYYRLHNADLLALSDIGPERIVAYQTLCQNFRDMPQEVITADRLRKGMYLFSMAFLSAMEGAPADHFRVDLKNGSISEIPQ